MNLYEYGHANPFKYFDLSGLRAATSGGTIAGAEMLLASTAAVQISASSLTSVGTATLGLAARIGTVLALLSLDGDTPDDAGPGPGGGDDGAECYAMYVACQADSVLARSGATTGGPDTVNSVSMSASEMAIGPCLLPIQGEPKAVPPSLVVEEMERAMSEWRREIAKVFDQALHAGVASSSSAERDEAINVALKNVVDMRVSEKAEQEIEWCSQETRLRIHGVKRFSDRDEELLNLHRYFQNQMEMPVERRDMMIAIAERLMRA